MRNPVCVTSHVFSFLVALHSTRLFVTLGC